MGVGVLPVNMNERKEGTGLCSIKLFIVLYLSGLNLMEGKLTIEQ